MRLGTTGNGIYAECSVLCRVPNHGHSANNLFAECRAPGTRQSFRTRYIPFFAEFQHSAKVQHSAYNTFAEFREAGTRQHLRTWPPRAPAVKPADGRYCLPSAGRQALSKPESSPSVFCRHSAKFVLPSAFRWHSANI